jgi:hypothetical protein
MSHISAEGQNSLFIAQTKIGLTVFLAAGDFLSA